MTSNLTDAAGLLKWRYAGASNAGRVTGGFSVSWVGGSPLVCASVWAISNYK